MAVFGQWRSNHTIIRGHTRQLRRNLIFVYLSNVFSHKMAP